MLLADIHRLLAPGGVMYLEVPLQFLGLPDLVARLRRKSQPYSDFSIHHHYFFSPSALHRLLTAGGFEVLSLATFVAARRAARPPGARKWLLQGALWLADRLARRGDVISVWARQRP